MVLLHVKKSDKQEFLFECSVNDQVDDVTKQVCAIHNLRMKMERLVGAAAELADHGPIKPEDQRGISDEEQIRLQEAGQTIAPPVIPEGFRHNPDPHSFRTGVAVRQDVADVLKRTAAEGDAVISIQQVAHKVSLTERMIQECIDNIRGAVNIAYPAYHGLPEYEPVVEILEDREMLDNKAAALDILDVEGCSLWFSGKEMLRTGGKKMSDYVGRNDKTKVVVRLQKRGAGPPVREPAIDEATQRNMMAFYHKKNEEAKKLAEDDEDSYLNSSWANPKALKNSLIGGGRDVSWKPR
eukprot:GILJ01005697.1.p1 GENE.GILJ01005697.1~~GILJ01005697.1.p1  ORF type:complete len:309 (-),score=56.47 GILJ01005697.1:102-989(-)